MSWPVGSVLLTLTCRQRPVRSLGWMVGFAVDDARIIRETPCVGYSVFLSKPMTQIVACQGCIVLRRCMAIA